MIENPDIVVAGAAAVATASWAFVAEAGQIKAEKEISSVEKSELGNVDQELERGKEDLEEDLNSDYLVGEFHNWLRHPYKFGKLGVYKSELEPSHSTEEDEYHNQMISDEDLEYLD